MDEKLKNTLKLPPEMVEKGAEANIYSGLWMDRRSYNKKENSKKLQN